MSLHCSRHSLAICCPATATHCHCNVEHTAPLETTLMWTATRETDLPNQRLDGSFSFCSACGMEHASCNVTDLAIGARKGQQCSGQVVGAAHQLATRSPVIAGMMRRYHCPTKQAHHTHHTQNPSTIKSRPTHSVTHD